MRVFVTGAAGYIGRVVVQELLENGHQVLGLARSNANVVALSEAGAEIHHGNLEDLESLKSGARDADGVIHLAFVHDFSNYAKGVTIDKIAVEAMLEALAGTGKPFVLASGTLAISPGKLATEASQPALDNPMSARYLTAESVYKFSRESQVRGSVIRLSPVVHGKADKGFIPAFIGAAQKSGIAAYADDGSARWPAVHKLDAAVLFRLALEKGTPAATYNAVAEEGIAVKDIMTIIGKQLQLPVETRTLNELQGSLGLLAQLAVLDTPTSSEKTQQELEWKPSQVGLLTDIVENYFT